MPGFLYNEIIYVKLAEGSIISNSFVGAVLSAVLGFVLAAAFAVGILWISWLIFVRKK